MSYFSLKLTAPTACGGRRIGVESSQLVGARDAAGDRLGKAARLRGRPVCDTLPSRERDAAATAGETGEGPERDAGPQSRKFTRTTGQNDCAPVPARGHDMSGNHRMRGIRAVRAQGAQTGLAQIKAAADELKATFDDFQRKRDGEINELRAHQDKLAKQVARIGVGGGTPGETDAKAALKPLTQFLRTGVSAAMRVGSDPDGGFTVTPEMDATIARFAQDVSPMRRLCRVVTTDAGAWEKLFSRGGTASGWVGETQARPTKAGSQMAKITIPTHEIYAFPETTRTLLDDSSFDIEVFVREEIVEEFDDQESDAFINGDGVMKPKGIMSYDTSTDGDATRAFGTIQYFATGSASGFPALSGIAGSSDPDALYNAVYGLQSRYRQRAAWQMNSATAGVIRKMKDGDGRPLWADSLAAGQPATLLGCPVEINEDFDDIGSDAFPIAFADWERAYTIVDRTGITMLRDELTNKPYVGFYTTKRVGGGLIDSRAIKLIKTAAS